MGVVLCWPPAKGSLSQYGLSNAQHHHTPHTPLFQISSTSSSPSTTTPNSSSSTPKIFFTSSDTPEMHDEEQYSMNYTTLFLQAVLLHFPHSHLSPMAKCMGKEEAAEDHHFDEATSTPMRFSALVAAGLGGGSRVQRPCGCWPLTCWLLSQKTGNGDGSVKF